MIHKAPTVKKWLQYQEAYSGDYFKNKKLPEYKSEMISNYIFGIIETMRPILLDNDPKFQAMPRQPLGMKYSSDLQEAFMYEWDRENMNVKLSSELINFLVLGNAIFYIGWDSFEKQVTSKRISPFNLFPDPLATSFEDSDYIMYADYFTANELKIKYPEKADKLVGGGINYTELINTDIISGRVDNRILVIEVTANDYDFEEVVEGGKSSYKRKYPHGRVMVIAPELGLLLEDKALIYDDGQFPFVIIKNYDVPGKFWGEGDVAQLMSPQKHINDLNSAIVDNAKTTANSPWIIDKNAGIPHGGITARPGLIIRKTPGSEVRREQPQQLPQYVMQANMTWKDDMEFISGVHSTLRGENATGVYTAQGVLALQEAGMIRVRLKTKMVEYGLSVMGNKWLSRMRQFWKDDRWSVVTQFDGSYDMKLFNREALQYGYNIKVTAGSTAPSNRGAMLDLMIRLAQTPMPDGQNIVDREAVVDYLPEEAKAGIMKRMQGEESNAQKMIMQLAQGVQELQGVVQATSAQVQDLAKESASNDEEIYGIIEQITATLQKMQDKTLQVEGKHDKMAQNQKEKEKLDQVKRQAYNQGFKDAEAQLSDEMPDDEEAMADLEGDEGLDGALPDDILAGIENMTDDELQLLIQKNPNIIDLLK